MKEKRNLIMKRCFALLLFLQAFAFQSCKDMYEDQIFMAFEDLPIGMYLKEHPEDYSQWADLLAHSGLYSTLNLQTRYTFFVPTNEGVSRYLQAHGYASVADIPKDDAAYLVRYHLIHGTAIDLGQFQSGAINDLNATDDNLTVEFRDGGLDAVYLNGESRFIRFDIKATNGVIHAIEDVLIPLTATIGDRLDDPAYRIFAEAVSATGYEDMLRRVYTQTTDPQGNPIEIRYTYTVFAVSDLTYQHAGINSFSELVSRLEAGNGEYTDSSNPLHQYVSYHIMEQLRSFVELGDFAAGQTVKNVNTLAANQLISITDQNGELLLNYAGVDSEPIRFTATDIPCKNGVIHEVDNWMPLFTPDRVTMIWELTDYPDLAANVTQYRNPSLGSQYNRSFQKGELTSYRWFSQPEDKANVLTYRNNRGADGAWYTGTINHDHLRLELGESGWIEMDSPVIVAGRYRIVLGWPSPRQANATGICAFALDGTMLRERHTISNTREDRPLEQVLGTMTFEETTSHTLRVVSLDGRLITLDFIRFEPID